MKRFLVSSCSILIVSIFSGCHSQPADNNAAFGNQKRFAVVELFTSQGCSSCPEADRLLGTLLNQYNNNEHQLIALSFHVDYWNRLGWKDPFSQPVFSERQKAYASQMNLESIYTPQAVINGKWETVGSKETQLKQYINKALAQSNTASLQITEISQNGKTLTISYAYEGSKVATALHFAIVQNKATTHIKAGENDGVTLNNFNIVRSWQTTEATNNPKQKIEIHIPEEYNTTEFRVFAFAQEKLSGSIIAVSTK